MAQEPPVPSACAQEVQRVCALHALDILDTAAEPAFDCFARIARSLFGTPIGTVSLIDSDRQFLKAAVGCERGSMARGRAICGWTVAQDEPLVVPDLAEDWRFSANPLVVSAPFYRFYAGAPLTNCDGLNLGALCCIDVRPRHPEPEQVHQLQDLAQVVVAAMEWRALATTDGLTGALTRRAFLETAARDLAQAVRHDRPLTCLVFDIDHFKAVNDRHGHAAGDDVLRRLAGRCREELRLSDYFGRLGGEEFAVILRDTPLAGALQVAERLRRRVAAEAFDADGRPLRVTISLGASCLRPGFDIAGLVAAADRALYAAKRAGRNRTMSEASAGPRLAVAG